mmetsp:Transcript_34387/g.75280  ORF Transcript_34387/g.75280 Transcript_34387/m.75280 type:complete len:1017 (+) Transcript_34387:138-3188(+)
MQSPSEDQDEDTSWAGMADKIWEVHKFGGTSVANADCYLKAASIVEEQLGIVDDGDSDNSNCASYSVDEDVPNSEKHLAVVVSAMGGKPKVTDLLLSAVKAAAERDDDGMNAALKLVLDKHSVCLDALNLEDDDNTGSSNSRSTDSSNSSSNKTSQRLKQVITSDMSDIRDILKTVSLMKWQASRISELVSGYGELWSAQIVSALLEARSRRRQRSASGVATGASLEQLPPDNTGRSHRFVYLDARRVITIDEDAIQDGAVVWGLSDEKLRDVYDVELAKVHDDDPDASLHFIVTGYVASNTHGVTTTLQRDGSDYSAAIMGRLLQSQCISIWTDVDGVLSADPRRVPNSLVIPDVSFNEAMELAYFGAKVIHPKTMTPAIMADPQIPIYIRNTFNSSFRGSRIFTSSTTHTDRDKCVCGFSSIENMALINVEGSGLVGVQGVAKRLFGTLESIGVSVVLISQASSEHSITFAAPAVQASDAKVAIEEEFRKELKQNHISNIDVKKPCAIIAAVGDGMSSTAGVSGRFFTALGDAKINVLAISQGCSERNISAVVWTEESTRALRAVHAAFRLSHTTVYIGIVGMNEIGDSLLKLLEGQRSKIRDTFEVDLQVRGVVSNGSDPNLITLKKLDDKYSDSITIGAYNAKTGGSLMLGAPALGSSVSFDEVCSEEDVAAVSPGGISSISDFVRSEDVAHSIIFDCTAEEQVGRKHADWLQNGVHVITANNSALSGPKEVREAIAVAETRAGKQSAQYLREVTVGGGLPVISTLRDLLNSGDKIRRVDGILSVSWSYIMHRIAPPPGVFDCSDFDEVISSGAYRGDHSMSPKAKGEPCSFSDAVREAIGLGLMEIDPIKDLSFEYTAQCLMVLAIELGVDKEYDIGKILAANPSDAEPGKDFDEISPFLDQLMSERVSEAAAKGCVPRQISSIDVKTGAIEIKIIDVPNNHIFATTPPSNECVRFFTARHKRYPMIVQGPSAGVDSTASALLAELLHLMRSKVGPRSGTLSRTGSSAVLA